MNSAGDFWIIQKSAFFVKSSLSRRFAELGAVCAICWSSSHRVGIARGILCVIFLNVDPVAVAAEKVVIEITAWPWRQRRIYERCVHTVLPNVASTNLGGGAYGER